MVLVVLGRAEERVVAGFARVAILVPKVLELVVVVVVVVVMAVVVMVMVGTIRTRPKL